MRSAICLVLGLSFAAAGCSSEPDAPPPPTQFQFGGDRPVFLDVPATYDHAQPTPLVLLLHGFGANGFSQAAFFRYLSLADEEGVLFAAPEGTMNPRGDQFWNATDACCDGFDSGVDDVAYLDGLIDEIAGVYNVDPARIYLAGHSNGGYMSYRMACDRGSKLAAIVSLAGATYLDAAKCEPGSAVSVLQIHGDDDARVAYAGGQSYPSAVGTVERWASYNGCAGGLTTADERLDLTSELPESDTRIERMAGCPEGIDVELWTIEGGGHIPGLTEEFRRQTWAWLAAHPKP